MKYQLLKWNLKDDIVFDLYEITDDSSLERLIWSSGKTNFLNYEKWYRYEDPTNYKHVEWVKWLSKEEAFIYTL
ncbi:MAG: hypothetical protein ACFFKA_00690 [Candidatus Thorarchaeota archaeon]